MPEAGDNQRLPIMNRIAVIWIACCCAVHLVAQCPDNIGFETGSFTHWKCFSGTISPQLVVTGSYTNDPLPGRYAIYSAGSDAGKQDPYGDFPVLCPNGSKYSIRIGNDAVGGEVDGVSYTFTVPADKSVYSIIYNYALVLQNPEHYPEQQPRFTAKVLDEATGDYFTCSSFDFAASSSLPGFKHATTNLQGGADVYYKTWAPVTIKLVGYAGKKLTIEFRVQDCTQGAHFGYAYLDVNEDCTEPIKGNRICEDATGTTLIAPFGFKEYRWYPGDFSQVLGTGSTLKLKPIPPINTKYAVEVLPYPGAGCPDTLYTTIEKAPSPFLFSFRDSIGVCPPATVDLTESRWTAGSSSGLTFQYFLDTAFNYLDHPKKVDTSGRYYVKASNAEGCVDLAPVVVSIDTVPPFHIVQPPPYVYPNTADLTDPSLYSMDIAGYTMRYWRDASGTLPVTDPARIAESGTYYVQVTNPSGCSAVASVLLLLQIAPPPNVFSPNGDGINDTWMLPGIQGFPDASVDIYDRNGGRVFHSAGYPVPWNGTMNGKPLPIGTYYYVIYLSPQLRHITGSVTLLR